MSEIAKSDSYLGNQLLKKGGIKRSWTTEEIQEVLKCKNDPIYFIETYFKLVVLGKGLTNIELYPLQKEIIQTCLDNRFICVLAARQSSKSTTIAALILYLTLFTPNHSSAILANKAATSREILTRIKTMFVYLPEFLKPGVEKWNEGDIKFSNGSTIFAASTSPDSIRGKSCDLVLCDEYAYVNNSVEFYASTFPVISSSITTKFIITSTPNGINHFHKIYNESVQGLNDYVSLKYIWSDVPGRDEKWKEDMLRTISQQQFNVEFLCEFAGSSSTLISGSKLEQLTYIQPIEKLPYLNIYQTPKEESIYVASCDVSEGIGKDYSVITIINITNPPYEVVLVYRNNTITPLDFSKIIFQLATKYNSAFLLVENNSIGKIVADTLHDDYEYENLVIDQKAINYRNGIRTSARTKSLGCSSLKTLIESDLLLINDYDLLSEIFSFIKKGNSFQAENSSKNDDIVMTLVLFSWFVQEDYFQDLTDCNIKRLVFSKEDVNDEKEEHLAFGFSSDVDETTDDFEDFF